MNICLVRPCSCLNSPASPLSHSSRFPGRLWIRQRRAAGPEPQGLAERLHRAAEPEEDVQLRLLREGQASGRQGGRRRSVVSVRRREVWERISKGVKAAIARPRTSSELPKRHSMCFYERII